LLGLVSQERRQRLGWRLRRLRRPPIFLLRRTRPLSAKWGWDRGTTIARYYIERFLEQNRSAIRGHALEVGELRYAVHYGASLYQADVIDVWPENPRATLIADLAAADSIPSGTFDCFILVQTLQYIYDLRAAIRHVHRILRPSGVVLCTLPAVSRVGDGHLDLECWRFTAASAHLLFTEVFEPDRVDVQSWGNAFAGVAFLAGMAAEELSSRQLEFADPHFPVLITVRAQR
jgi:SAM-dependent methyltransferase